MSNGGCGDKLKKDSDSEKSDMTSGAEILNKIVKKRVLELAKKVKKEEKNKDYD